jgi:hypothetical protein
MAKKHSDRSAYWRGVLGRHARSSLSVRAFCVREQVSEPSFYAWRRTLQERDAAEHPRSRPAFLPATLLPPREEPSPPAPPEGVVIELHGGRLLRLPASMAPARLAELVYALEATEAPS